MLKEKGSAAYAGSDFGILRGAVPRQQENQALGQDGHRQCSCFCADWFVRQWRVSDMERTGQHRRYRCHGGIGPCVFLRRCLAGVDRSQKPLGYPLKAQDQLTELFPIVPLKLILPAIGHSDGLFCVGGSLIPGRQVRVHIEGVILLECLMARRIKILLSDSHLKH